MAFLVLTGGLIAAALVTLVLIFHRRRSLRQLRGPPSSFFFGNICDFPYQENVGDLDFRWVREYGTTWRIGGILGEDILMLADPKALQHIFHKSGYNYPKSVDANVMARVIAGRGILWAHGDVHQRHRKVMGPAFTAPQLRSFLPLFRRQSLKMCQQWKDDVLSVSSGGETIVVNRWIARLTLDVIGQAAFDFNFGALDNDHNFVSEAYKNMFIDSNMYPSRWNILFRACWRYLPARILDFVDYIPTREYARFRRTTKIINKLSEDLITEKTDALLAGDLSKKDAMSVLVRANLSENPKSKLSGEEMVAQTNTLTLAGHETTANTLTWYLWELAKNPEFQDKLRAEVMALRSQITDRGETDVTIEHLDSMTLLQAGIKETLRFHPIAYHLTRVAEKDDIVPLATPIFTKSGQMLSEIPVRAGQSIVVSICAYNRLHDVWGEDAHLWNPMRFVENSFEKQVKIGTYSNIMSFSAGVRSCLGWRFSVIEMQAIMFDLIEHFRFTLPEEKMEIRRLPAGVMSPVVKEKMHEGLYMPLRVTLVSE